MSFFSSFIVPTRTVVSLFGACILLAGACSSKAATPKDASKSDVGRSDSSTDTNPLLANGEVCASGAQCQSGLCTDGVCCGTACDGLCMACAAAKTGMTDGVCAPVTEDTDPDAECDEDVTVCDSDFCDGAGACKSLDDGTECRPVKGICDISERCEGGVCPATDAVVSAGTGCRNAPEPCGAGEFCDGINPTCPPDVHQPQGARLCPDNFACNGLMAECPTSCTDEISCDFGLFCVSSKCEFADPITNGTFSANLNDWTSLGGSCLRPRRTTYGTNTSNTNLGFTTGALLHFAASGVPVPPAITGDCTSVIYTEVDLPHSATLELSLDIGAEWAVTGSTINAATVQSVRIEIQPAGGGTSLITKTVFSAIGLPAQTEQARQTEAVPLIYAGRRVRIAVVHEVDTKGTTGNDFRPGVFIDNVTVVEK